MSLNKVELLAKPIGHIDITSLNVVGVVDQMRQMAFSARDLARAADIYQMMLQDAECDIILCLAGSLISAGLKKVVTDMIRNKMVDCIVSTGANIVDQDFFEGLGFSHYRAPESLKSGMCAAERPPGGLPAAVPARRRGRRCVQTARRWPPATAHTVPGARPPQSSPACRPGVFRQSAQGRAAHPGQEHGVGP